MLAQNKRSLVRMRDNSQVALLDNENRFGYYSDLLDDVEEQLKTSPSSAALQVEKQMLQKKVSVTEKKIDFYRERGKKAEELLQGRSI